MRGCYRIFCQLRVPAAALVLFLHSCNDPVMAQDSSSSTFHAGLCVRKMTGFYWLNGFSIEHQPHAFAGRMHFGLNLASSVLGSAFMSKAIPVYCYELYGQFSFRRKRRFQPYAGLNGGLAYADHGPSFGDHLTSVQPLLSVEPGFRIAPVPGFNVTASVGYNFFTGNGVRGLGTIYPLYLQLRLLSALRWHRRPHFG